MDSCNLDFENLEFEINTCSKFDEFGTNNTPTQPHSMPLPLALTFLQTFPPTGREKDSGRLLKYETTSQ